MNYTELDLEKGQRVSADIPHFSDDSELFDFINENSYILGSSRHEFPS